MAHSENIAFYIAALIGIGAACQWLAWRLNLPAILPLLVTGLLLGPALGVFDPDAALGELLFPIVSLAVAVILFEGSLTLKFSDVRNTAPIIRNLTSVGVLVTCGTMGVAAHYFADLSWPLALLFGALVSVTGPTVIMPMLRSIKTTERIANILRWEGILIDPIGAALAVLVFEFIHTGGAEAQSLLEFLKIIVVGTLWGLAGGFSLAQILKRNWLPDYLVNYFSLGVVLLVFTASNLLGDESGLIAVTVMGMVMANTKGLDVRQLLSFKEDLTLLLISVLFILLAARLQLDQIQLILVPSLIILLVALFVARPLAVWISSIGSDLSAKEKILLAWVAPRGIVAAAVSALFALRLESDGNEQAFLLVPLTFMIIIGTVVIQSLSAGWLASRLGLSSRGEQGVLISGSNEVARAIGAALHKQGIKVKIVDTNQQGLHQARMSELETFYGNPLSEYAERYMDLTGYTHLLALSRKKEFNAVVCAQFRHEFDSSNVFAVHSAGPDENHSRKGLSPNLRFNFLFSPELHFDELCQLLDAGHVFRATALTETFGLEDFEEEWGDRAKTLFALDDNQNLQVRVADQEWKPETGWTLISLMPPNGNGQN